MVVVVVAAWIDGGRDARVSRCGTTGRRGSTGGYGMAKIDGVEALLLDPLSSSCTSSGRRPTRR